MKKSNEKGIFATLLNCLAIGISVGVPISVICMTIIGGVNETILEIIAWIIASALFGLLSAVFFIERFNLIVTTIIHCIGCFVITVAVSTVLGYGNSLWDVILTVLPVFVIIYAALYIFAVIYSKIQANRINKELNK